MFENNTVSATSTSLVSLSSESLSPYSYFYSTGLSAAPLSMMRSPVSAEGIVSLNQKVNFAGDRLNLADDALLYAGRGVNFNQSPDFSLKLDSAGNPIRDAVGLLQAREGAFTLGSGYTTLNRPNNPYSGSLEIVAPRSVQIPGFNDVLTTALRENVPSGGVFSQVNAQQSPINSVGDWQRLFVNGRSVGDRTLIRVTGGSLNIPDGATLKNAVVIVECGDINLNGQSPKFENVMFVAENGSVNLGNVQGENLVVMAGRSVHMNSAATFSGRTLIANGCGDIAFNGAMVSDGPEDFLTVVSQGQLFFNASSDVRGELLSRGDFFFNSATEVLGAIQTKGNLTFNGAGSVRSLSVDLTPDPTPDPDPIPVNRIPQITTTPNLQALVGDIYRYNVDAVDADGDALVYSLVSSPLGMTIDPATGQINWNTATKAPGAYQTEVQVVDGRGGLAKQTFSINLTAPVIEPDPVVKTGEIRGVVWDDINRNGVIDSNLVRGQNPDIVFVLDISGSTREAFDISKTGPIGDLNKDGEANTILDAEIASIRALRNLLISQGYGDRARVSVVAFASSAVNLDMNPQVAGLQTFTSLTADANGNGISDIEDALVTLRSGGETSFERALQRVESTFMTLNSAPGSGNLIFLTDGLDNSTRVVDEVARLNALGINLSAFGVGSGASVTNLRRIDPNAQVFTSTDQLLALFSGVQGGDSQARLEPGLANVRVYLDLNGNGRLDTNEPTQITNAAGEYRFTGVNAGTYQVRSVIPTNYQQTFPISSGSYQVTLVGDDVVLDRNFGVAIIS